MDGILRKKFYKLWHNMKSRCYNHNHPRYPSYGGSGVTMCDKWLSFNGFLEDIVDIEGYSERDILKGNIHLDKDSRDITNKIYNIEKCKFINIETNNKFKPNQMRGFIATAPNGEEFEGLNISEFARVHYLNQSTISACLNNKIKKHKGWIFRLV